MADLETVQSRLVDLAGRVDGKADSNGGEITGSLQVDGNLTVLGIGQKLWAWKTAALGRTATTRSNDPDLSLTANPAYTYACTAALHYWSGTAGSGFVLGWSASSWNGRLGYAGNLAGTGAVTQSMPLSGVVTSFGTPAGTDETVLLDGVVWGGSGTTFAVSWCSGNGVQVNLNPGS